MARSIVDQKRPKPTVKPALDVTSLAEREADSRRLMRSVLEELRSWPDARLRA